MEMTGQDFNGVEDIGIVLRKLGKLGDAPNKEPSPKYGEAEYWEKRYAKAGGQASFDWLESYATLKDYLGQFMPSQEVKILVLGCGNAEFSEDLYDAGYENQVNIDISEVVIKQMAERNEEKRPNLKF